MAPPGIVYLGMNLHHIFIPLAFVYAINHLFRRFLEIDVPQWLFVLASVLACPIAFTFKVSYKLYVNNRQAAAHGAVLPPQLPDKYIGGFETLSRTLAQYNTLYIGEENVVFFKA
jgi:hypothetical protein